MPLRYRVTSKTMYPLGEMSAEVQAALQERAAAMGAAYDEQHKDDDPETVEQYEAALDLSRDFKHHIDRRGLRRAAACIRAAGVSNQDTGRSKAGLRVHCVPESLNGGEPFTDEERAIRQEEICAETHREIGQEFKQFIVGEQIK